MTVSPHGSDAPLVSIVGAGAVGGLLAAMLSRARRPVELVVRPSSLGAIGRGLKVTTRSESFVAAVPSQAEPSSDAGLIVVAVKLPDLQQACATIAAYLAKRGAVGQSTRSAAPAVLLLQNGLDSADIASRYLPGAGVLSGVVEFGATSLEPGEITYTMPGRLIVGAPAGGRSALAQAAAMMLRPAVPVRISHDIRSAQRLKLIVNLNNGATAATGLTVQQLYARTAGVRLSIQLMREGVAAFDAAGVTLGRTLRSRLLRSLLSLPAPLAAAAFRQAGRRLMRHLPVYGSTLQSLLRGRPTEVHELNGVIVRLGQSHGIPTPVNRVVVARVEAVERAVQAAERPPFVSAEQLLADASAHGAAEAGSMAVPATGRG